MKTLEEFMIKEVQNLREENEQLKDELTIASKMNDDLAVRRNYWKNKYEDLVKRIKEDLKPEMRTSAGGRKYIISNNNYIWDGPGEEDQKSYQYYKELFNLKEETNE